MKSREEKALVQKFRNKDEFAIRQIYQNYYPRIFSLIYSKTRDVYLAEDIAQQSFVNALSNIDSYRWVGKSFGAWLYTIANNLLMTYYRRESKVIIVPIEEIDEHMATDNNSSEAIYLKNEEIYHMKNALPRLNSDQITVLKLRFEYNMSLSDTAFLLNKSISWVKVVQYRALIKMRSLIAA